MKPGDIIYSESPLFLLYVIGRDTTREGLISAIPLYGDERYVYILFERGYEILTNILREE